MTTYGSCRKNGKFVTSVYRKPTLSGFSPVMKVSYQRTKRGLSYTLLHRSFSICCDFKTFHLEIDRLKTILRENNYPPNFIYSWIKSFLNKLYKSKVIIQNVPKEMFLLSCHSWEILRSKCERSFKIFTDKFLTSCIVKIVFTSPVRVQNFFTFKDKFT